MCMVSMEVMLSSKSLNKQKLTEKGDEAKENDK